MKQLNGEVRARSKQGDLLQLLGWLVHIEQPHSVRPHRHTQDECLPPSHIKKRLDANTAS